MRKTKSFRLNHEQNTRPKRQFSYEYSSKKVCWMKFFVIVLLIGFVLLLVLSNVDFSDESYELTAAASTVRLEEILVGALNATSATYNQNTANDTSDGITAGEIFLERSVEAISERTGVTCTDNNSCKSVICTGGPIYTLSYQLEDFIPDCGSNYLDVILENCTFNGSAIGQYTMSGIYKLNSLTIRNCKLESIVNGAFKQKTVQNLINLTLHGTQFETLNAKSFEGLEAVKHFELLNVQKNDLMPLQAQNFLQPLVGNLKSLVLQQSQSACNQLITYDPSEWLGSNAGFPKLSFVDLSGTQFNDTLNGSTFTNLLAVVQLLLASCSLNTIAEGTFDAILNTLKFIDLRDNQLQVLDGNFLTTAATNGIDIQMAGNQWRCECDNQAIIEYVRQTQDTNNEEPLCASPTGLAGIKVRLIDLDCNETNITQTTSESIVSSPKRTSTTSLYTTTIHNLTESIGTTDATISLVTKSTWSPTVTSKPLTMGTITSTTRFMTTIPPGFEECYGGIFPRFMYCEGLTKKEGGLIPLCDYDALFNVEATSPTCVQLRFDDNAYGLRVIYFQVTEYNSTFSVDIYINNSMDICHLTSEHSYVFCLMQINSLKTSPFNCRSTYLPLEKAVAWLVNRDKALFYTLATILILICCLLGMATCYWLLRYRPTLVRGNKRLRRVASTSYEVLLYAKSFDRSSLDSTQFALKELSKMRSSISDTLTSENYLKANSYDYMQYFKGLEMHREPKVIYNSENRPPINLAPTFPPQAVEKCCGEHRRDCSSEALRQQSSQCLTVPRQGDLQSSTRFRMCQQDTTTLQSENVYESLDYYQELY